MAYRERWHRDVVIDVIGYRRYGHNETDEPAYTQPTIAAKIKDHKPVSELYAEQADRRGRDHRRDRPAGGRSAQSRDVGGAQRAARADGGGRLRGPDRRHRHRRTRPHRQPDGRHLALRRHADQPERGTAAGAGRLQRPPQAPPPARPPHRRARRRRHRLRPGRGARLQLADHRRHPHRLTGQDTERGTFSTATSSCTTRTPASSTRRCRTCREAKAPFELHNSPLSEVACLGFEYGYSAATRARWSSGRRSSATSPTGRR